MGTTYKNSMIFQSIYKLKYRLADFMRNNMHMPDDLLQHLDIYYLKHMHIPEFKNALIDGQVSMYGYNFNVIYYLCTPAKAKAAQEIRLSFRKAKPEFNIEPYVLVQIVRD